MSEGDMSDDVIRYILELVCNMQARRNFHPVEARLATGEDSKVTLHGESIVKADGIIRSKETILLDVVISCRPWYDEHVRPIRASKMAKTVDEGTKPGDLCIVDPIGDESGEYCEERIEHGEEVRLACLGWGVHKQVSYSMRLSHAMSVSVAFDVLVVPTSWWVNDCGTFCGTFWVVQMVNENESSELDLESHGYSRLEGYDVVGWVSEDEE